MSEIETSRIPIQNIYYLLCYAWDKLEERDIVAVEAIDSTSLAELFARVLINGTNHLVKRGFDRGYIRHHEWTGRLRGRILFHEAIRRNALKQAALPCEYDDLSHDVLHNQILKATIGSLMRVEGLASSLGEGLARLHRMMSAISDIEVTARTFGRVQLHRNNQFYDFLLKICELIHGNLLASERTGVSRFMDFVQDRRQMAYVFENFVRNFYRVHATKYSVKREEIYWRWTPTDGRAAALLPKMQTDVSLTSQTHKIIIDCKFTPEATRRNYDAEKLRESHLYQINAYLSNLPPDRLTESCEIMLLYPTVDAPLEATYEDQGRRIGVRTINLNQPWQCIHEDLMRLVA